VICLVKIEVSISSAVYYPPLADSGQGARLDCAIRKRIGYHVTIMSKYLVLYRSEGALTGPSVSEMLSKTTAEQLAAGMGAWRAWHEKCGGAIVDLGAPLDHSTTVAGGAGTPGKTSITGYTLLEAGSLDEAVRLMKDHPHFHMPGASVQILECIAMPGM
jgi:hypothetical protein